MLCLLMGKKLNGDIICDRMQCKKICKRISKDRTVSGGHGREKRSFHHAKSIFEGF